MISSKEHFSIKETNEILCKLQKQSKKLSKNKNSVLCNLSINFGFNSPFNSINENEILTFR